MTKVGIQTIILSICAVAASQPVVSALVVQAARTDTDTNNSTAAITVLLLAPPVFVALVAQRQALHRALIVATVWSIALGFIMPIFFGPANAIAPHVITQDAPTLPTPPPIDPGSIALPYEGNGRRLSIPVAVGHGAIELEFDMMLDTGATYTTLPARTLAMMGVRTHKDTPTVELHTANGVRSAQMVVIDKLWLGDMLVEGVTVAVCDACEGEETIGLLGLNVTSAFNLAIDADRQELNLSPRAAHDQRLDITVFTKISAEFTRYPNGEIDVTTTITNRADRTIQTATVQISCDDNIFAINISAIPANGTAESTMTLPHHPDCEPYIFELTAADW